MLAFYGCWFQSGLPSSAFSSPRLLHYLPSPMHGTVESLQRTSHPHQGLPGVSWGKCSQSILLLESIILKFYHFSILPSCKPGIEYLSDNACVLCPVELKQHYWSHNVSSNCFSLYSIAHVYRIWKCNFLQ